MNIRNEINNLIKQINNQVKEEPEEIVVIHRDLDPDEKSDPARGFFVIRPHFGSEDADI